MPQLSELSIDRLEAMAAAGDQILECYRVLQKSNANVVGELLRGQGEFFEWDHYPSGDVYDSETHSQYYYHAHPPEDRTIKWGGEHGHFHTFLRPKGMPAKIKPADIPEYEKPKGDNDALTHYVGISMNRAGFPIRLFTTNRWVTGEVWYTAESVISLLDRFEMDLALPSWPVNIWATSMLRLFRPQIETLLVERDARIAEWQIETPGENVFEDRKRDITSVADISVEDQIKQVKRALKKTAA